MAEHRIVVTQPAREVVNNDYIFEIFSDATKLGELQMSRGGVDWWTRNAKTETSLTWEELAMLLDACRVDLAAMRDSARQITAAS